MRRQVKAGSAVRVAQVWSAVACIYFTARAGAQPRSLKRGDAIDISSRWNGSAASVRASTTGVSWGPSNHGLQSGIRLLDGRRDYLPGETIWMEYFVRNTSRATRTVTLDQWNLYSTPPPTIAGAGGRPVEVAEGSGQIVYRHSTRLLPGAAALTSTPNILARIPAITAHYEMATQHSFRAREGSYRLFQRGDVEVEGVARPVTLTSGAVEFRVVRPETPAAWGETVDGLQAGLAFASGKSAYRVGDRVGFLFFLRNVTDMPVTFVLRGDTANHLYPDIIDSAGAVHSVLRTIVMLLPTPTSYTLGPGERMLVEAAEVRLVAGAAAPELNDASVHLEPGAYRVRQALRGMTEYLGAGVHGRGEGAAALAPVSGELVMTVGDEK